MGTIADETDIDADDKPWAVALLSLGCGYVMFFITRWWLSEAKPEVTCAQEMELDECQRFLIANVSKHTTAVLDRYSHCCYIKDTQYDFTAFVAMLGGTMQLAYSACSKVGQAITK